MSFTKVGPDTKRRSCGQKTLRRRSPRGVQKRCDIILESDSDHQYEGEEESEDEFVPSVSEDYDSSEDSEREWNEE